MKIFKSILFCILYTAIYFIIQVIVQLLMLFVWGYSFAMENLTLTVIVSSIISFLIYWGIVKLRKQKLASACSFIKFDYSQIPALVLLGFLIQYFFQGLILILGLDKLFPEHEAIMKMVFEGGRPLMIILSVIILAPFIEEVLFRGLIINELKGKMPFVLVIFIQALIFGVIHGNWLQIIYASILGILLGLISTWCHSVWPAIILHISMNGTPFLSELLWDSKQIEQFVSDYRIPVTVTSGVIVIAIMYFIYRKNHTEPKISAIEIPDSATIQEGETNNEIIQINP
jgi:membrane protease YdiL (CAAX protease family)